MAARLEYDWGEQYKFLRPAVSVAAAQQKAAFEAQARKELDKAAAKARRVG